MKSSFSHFEVQRKDIASNNFPLLFGEEYTDH